MEYCFYIAKNVKIIKGTKISEIGDLLDGERIIAFPTNLPLIIGSKDLEGPFLNIENLIKHSIFYNELKLKNPKRARKIIKQEYIEKTVDLILSPKNETYSFNFIDGFVHSISGNFDNNDVTGIHFYDSSKIKITEILGFNKNGIWRAKIEAFDWRTKKWIKKEKPSDFFPIDWNKTRLLEELNFANQSKTLIVGTKHKYEGVTKSGIHVIFIVINEKIKTVYPVYEV
jgi:hypothetical protein